MSDEKLARVKQHTVYKVDGKRVPGVTTVLGILAKPALIKWANNLGLEGIDSTKYVDKLASIGTLAHYRIECELRGEEPDLTPFSSEELDKSDNAMMSWYAWQDDHVLEPILVEEPLTSKEYRFGGSIDCYGKVDGKLTLLDFKTSKGIFPEHFHQLAAYVHLLIENGHHVHTARILRIGRAEDEGFEDRVVDVENLDNNWRMFELCREIYDLQKLTR